MRYLLLALSLALPTGVVAQSFDSMNLAVNLGSVLAAEKKCGLSFNQNAIEAYIEEHVSADDMGFPSSLTMMTGGAEVQLSELSQSSLTAHCAQIKRIAKSYGFTE